jgi:uncharacterized protein with PQ loop repeat
MLVHPSLLVNFLIVVGESFWVFSDAAQLYRLVSTRNTRGLSAPSQTLNAAGNIAWCTYFALNHLWFPFFTNIIVITLTILILGYTLSNRKQFIRGLLTIIIVGPVTSFGLIHYTHQSGWFGMGYNWLAATPQLVRIVRHRKVSGLSESGLYFAISAMLLVLSYGLIIRSMPLVAGCIQGLVYSVIILKHYYHYRKYD